MKEIGKKKPDNLPIDVPVPQIFMGEEYPAHFRFYERHDPPKEGEEVGYVWSYIAPNKQGHKPPETKLIWNKGCVNQVSEGSS